MTRLSLDPAIQSACDTDEFYEILRIAGPFDGGCLVTALALQRLLGGSLYALRYTTIPIDQHILLKLPKYLGLGDCYADANGVKLYQEVVHFWQEDRSTDDAFCLVETSWLAALEFGCGAWNDYRLESHQGIPQSLTPNLVVDELVSYFQEALKPVLYDANRLSRAQTPSRF